jgi:acyl carrier protein
MIESVDHVEAVVAKIWQQVLKVDKVDPADNFLDLGGNSLRAGEIANRIQRELGIEISMDLVLGEETFASFSRAVSQHRDAPAV